MATSRSAPCSDNAADPDVVIVMRTTEGGAGRVSEPHAARRRAAATTSAAAVSTATRRHSGLRGSGAADTVAGGRVTCLVIEYEERRSDVGDPFAAILDETPLK